MPAKKNARKNGHTPGLYTAYSFREKDPEIERLKSMAENYYGTRVTGREMSAIRKDGGPSQACMRAWWYGETKRPTNATLEACGRAMGFERVWKRMRDNK